MVEEGVELFVKDADNGMPRLDMEAQWAREVTPLMSTGLRLPRPRISSSGMQKQM